MILQQQLVLVLLVLRLPLLSEAPKGPVSLSILSEAMLLMMMMMMMMMMMVPQDNSNSNDSNNN